LVGVNLKSFATAICLRRLCQLKDYVFKTIPNYQQENIKSFQTDPGDIFIIETDTPGKSILTNGKGDTLYAEDGDSVLIYKFDIRK